MAEGSSLGLCLSEHTSCVVVNNDGKEERVFISAADRPKAGFARASNEVGCPHWRERP